MRLQEATLDFKYLPYWEEQIKLTEFGNASSIDPCYGDHAEKAVSQAATQVAELIGTSRKEIVFTSGATESINLAIQGTISCIPPLQVNWKLSFLP
jgi:cysteine sulfinate desulfinase/cysteine desulfurase-like protein